MLLLIIIIFQESIGVQTEGKQSQDSNSSGKEEDGGRKRKACELGLKAKKSRVWRRRIRLRDVLQESRMLQDL